MILKKNRYCQKDGTRRFWAFWAMGLCAIVAASAYSQTIVLETQYLRYVIAEDGSNLHFINRQTGIDYCDSNPVSKCAILTLQGRQYEVSAAAYDGRKMTLTFGQSGVIAEIGVESKEKYMTFEVLDLRNNNNTTDLSLINLSLNLKGEPEEPFTGCAVPLNLQMYSSEIPGFNKTLRGYCNRQDGIVGAKMAVMGCPGNALRAVLKQIIQDHKNLPQTEIGGPWAIEAEINRGSYLIDHPGSLSEKNVDQWILLAHQTGARQIDMHCGHTLRFGDLRPDPDLYPNGLEGVKRVVDKLHDAGVAAGLHTYAFFIAKDSEWVCPVPDPRLGKGKVFTLSKNMDGKETSVWVEETTEEMSTLTAFHIDNSVTLQIDDELIVYTEINKKTPYAFTKCQRGAWGTKPASHLKNAKVYHLKERFGLFSPDGDSTLFTEVARRTADVYNQCGFDMIYLDAIDGAASITGRYTPGYYQGKFVFELCRELKKPALMEMSSFDSHLWFPRSRLGAWDAPSKAYKWFIDRHFTENDSARKWFLPTNLGWWCIFDWAPKDRIRTFPDDVEYLMCKSLASDSSLSWLMGFDPEKFPLSYHQKRMASLIRQYEELRLSNYFPESVKKKLAQPGQDFSLEPSGGGQWQLRPVHYDQHNVAGVEGQSNIWETQNPYGPQPIKLRIEAMLSLADYEDAGNTILATFKEPKEFSDIQSAAEVVCQLETASNPVKAGSWSGSYSAQSNQSDSNRAWSMVNKTFTSDVDLSQRGFGVWIYGDGNGEVLNFLWKTPSHISIGASEHYAVIDFVGWRYFEFVEPESGRVGEYKWPYHQDSGVPYTETFWVDYTKLNSLSLGYILLPAGKEVKCYLSPIKALPHIKAKLINPSVTVGGKTLYFPAEIESGCYLEFRSMGDCKLYDSQGELVKDIKPQGEVPFLRAGENQIQYNCTVSPAVRARVNVTVITQSDTVLHP